MENKISIIIPMYNEAPYISRFLESLENQSYKDLSPETAEIILIDDGSTDKTLEIAEWFNDRLKDKFSFIILKPEHCWLPWKIRNYWASLAKWDIFIFVDADMVLDSKYIEELIKPILEWKEVGTTHWWEYVANLDNKIARAYQNIRLKYDPTQRVYEYRAILKRIFVESGGYIHTRWYFDGEIGRIDGISGLFVPTSICYHNNPETLGEVYRHSIWVGRSLMKGKDTKAYLLRYKYRIIAFFTLFFITFWYWLIRWNLYILPALTISIILLLIIFKTIQRTVKEKYLSHIIFIPTVMITRWLGYTVWLCKYILFRK